MLVLEREVIGFFELAKNLRFPQHQGVQAAGDLEQVLEAVRLVQLVNLIVQRPAVGAPIDEELLQGRERVPGSASAGSVNLDAVAGGKNDRFLSHALRPQLLNR